MGEVLPPADEEEIAFVLVVLLRLLLALLHVTTRLLGVVLFVVLLAHLLVVHLLLAVLLPFRFVFLALGAAIGRFLLGAVIATAAAAAAPSPIRLRMCDPGKRQGNAEEENTSEEKACHEL